MSSESKVMQVDDHLSHVTSRPTRDLHYYGNISLILLRALMYRTGCPLRLSEVHNSEASSDRSCPPYCEDRWLVGASQERRRVSDFTSSKHHNHTLHTAHRRPACLGGKQSSHQLLTRNHSRHENGARKWHVQFRAREKWGCYRSH